MLNSKFTIEKIYFQYSINKINWSDYPTPEFAKVSRKYTRHKINDEDEWSEPYEFIFTNEKDKYYEELDRNQPLEKILMGYWYSLIHKIKNWRQR